jgi:signal transduction histidine kinase
MACILIVDDEEGVQASLVKAFTLEGYQAVGAGSGTQALSLLRRQTFDVLLTDLVMPDLDGVSLMEGAQAISPSMVVIVMTGGATVESAVRALKGGAYDYVLKPFTLAEIFHTVRRGLELQNLKQQNLQLSQINRRLQEIDQIKSNLLSAITHEFRTPLTVMHGWLDLLLGGQFGSLSAQQQDSLSVVRGSAVRLGRLIANLLAFVESDRGQVTRERVAVSLEDLLRRAAAKLDSDCEERGVRLRWDMAHELPTIMADGERLQLVFFNLLENAIKFNEAGGLVVVQGTEAGAWVEVAITNTLGDLPPDGTTRLGQPFTQGDMSATRPAGGLGLGLALVRSILEAHGGQLTFRSGKGQGTTVRVRLPLSR